jgi:hypothetical protein
MAQTLSWVATAATVLAALITAANLGTRITGYGFCVFLVGSLAWLASGIIVHQAAMSWNNAILTGLNIFGIWRWLGRQAEVEEGAATATRKSRAMAGENLFPVSLLTSAEVVAGTTRAGRCVDAMAGCSSGSVRYLVVSTGGVAGMGETLRRLEWDNAHVEEGTDHTDLGLDEFDALEQLERDKWPAR